MMIAQAILVTPIIAALTPQTIEDLWLSYRDLIIVDGTGAASRMAMLLSASRFSLLTAVLAGLGRASAEVGAIVIADGNIAGATPTMTTAIALETGRSDLSLALAWGSSF